MKIYGNYELVIKFEGIIDDFAPDFGVRSFVIVQDLNKMAPSFRMQVIDDTGELTHLNPVDSVFRKLQVQLIPIKDDAEDTVLDKEVDAYTFRIYRVKPKSIWEHQNIFDVVGLLDVDGLFEPPRTRGFVHKSMKEIFEYIAQELGISSEISLGLDSDKIDLVQPNITNAQWLKSLEPYLYDSNNFGFKIFIKVRDGKPVLVAKGLQELLGVGARVKFVVNDLPIEDRQPVFDYRIYSGDVVRFGLPVSYGYFDYENGRYMQNVVSLDDYISLGMYLAIDQVDLNKSNILQFYGRTVPYFEIDSVAKSVYYSGLINSVKMWIDSWGIPNICPGDIVDVLFPQGLVDERVFGFQYNGRWLVERVVQSFGKTHRTRLLLTRGSVDYDSSVGREPGLVKSNKVVTAI